ncbi:MAG TPA: TOMM precursor leader peptide-binding protein [Streptosporangiaceae bacterium]|nr:TOMM precursor leader peptide-binding protein [Streptosporangiaceae bacterium]
MQNINRTIAVCGDGLVADAVDLALRELATIKRVTAGTLAASGSWDGLVVASDHRDQHPDRNPHSAAHQASQARLVPWMPVLLELDTAVVGPVARPDRPGCPVCFDLRRKNNPRENNPVAAETSNPQPAKLDQLAAGLIGTLAASEFTGAFTAEADRLHRLHRLPASAVLVRLADLTIERHRFLAEPMCPACGDLPDDTREDAVITLSSRPKQAPNRYRLWSPTDHSEEIVSTYVGSEAGLIHDITRIAESGLAVAEASVTLRVPGAKVPGGGRTWDYRTSEAVAVLEALERYGGSNPAGKRTVLRSAMADLNEPALDPRRLGEHEDDVYDKLPHLYRPFTEESVCNWVWGYSLTAGQPVLVPESSAYFWTLNHPDPVFLADTTNGCALGSCLEEAILYGILEVAERDAFLLTWHSQLPAPAIDLDSSQDREPAITAAAITASTGYDVTLFDITTEVGIPSVWAMATHPALPDGGLPPGTDELALFCAAGSHLTPERAALSALVELGPQLVDAINRYPARKADATASLTSPDVVRTIFDHAVAFGDPRAYSRLSFLTRPPTPTREPTSARPLAQVGGDRRWPAHADLRDDLTEMINRFRDENLEVIVVDQTGPEHRALGLHCVRVLIPGTLPLTYGHSRRRLRNLPRLLTLPNRLGHAEAARSLSDINQLPHPFAA